VGVGVVVVVVIIIIINGKFKIFEDMVLWDVIMFRIVDSSSKILVPLFQATYKMQHPRRE
jgi:hypothetical protein